MNHTQDANSAMSDLIKSIENWSETPEGKTHKQFILSMLIVLKNSNGIIPTAEIRKNNALALLWPKEGKQYGVLLDSSGSIVNICKEEDGRLFASTKINS